MKHYPDIPETDGKGRADEDKKRGRFSKRSYEKGKQGDQPQTGAKGGGKTTNGTETAKDTDTWAMATGYKPHCATGDKMYVHSDFQCVRIGRFLHTNM